MKKGTVKVTTGLCVLALAGTLVLGCKSCVGEANLSNITPSAILEIQEVKDVTQMDELLLNNQLRFEGEQDIVEAADELQFSLDIIDELKDMDFTGVEGLQELTDEQYQEVFSLPIEEIRVLKKQASYKGKDLALVQQKLIALKQLDLLYRTCLSWVHQYGQDVSFGYMMAAVKCSVADELNVPYSSITLPPAYRSSSMGPQPYVIKVGDQTYQVPVGARELWDTINYIYEIQGAKLTEKTEFPTYRKAINFGKITIAAGSDSNGKGKLVEQHDMQYIKKNYVNK